MTICRSPRRRQAGARRPALPADLAYLPGHTLGELLDAEYEATSAALAEMGRMSCTLRLPELTPDSLGEAIMFFQLATGYAGVWYGIDPFDQPGVELGKRLTYAAMGRPGLRVRRPARRRLPTRPDSFDGPAGAAARLSFTPYLWPGRGDLLSRG